jgi:hypothetical protein
VAALFSRVSWLEVVLVVVFGVVAGDIASYVDERTRSALTDSDAVPDSKDEELTLKVLKVQSAATSLDQQLTALRAQQIASRIENWRREAEVGVRKAIRPTGQTPPAGASDPASPEPAPSTGKALEDAMVAAASSAAIDAGLARDIEELAKQRQRNAADLLRVQREVAVHAIELRHDRKDAWRWQFLACAGAALGALSIVAGAVGFALGPQGRHRAAGGVVLGGVVAIALTILAYHLSSGLVVIAAGFAVLVVLAGARMSR